MGKIKNILKSLILISLVLLIYSEYGLNNIND
jgi:hypothetical protein